MVIPTKTNFKKLTLRQYSLYKHRNMNGVKTTLSTMNYMSMPDKKNPAVLTCLSAFPIQQ